MHDFFYSAIMSTSDFVRLTDSNTRPKRLYFIDDLSAAKANGHIEGIWFTVH